MRFLGNVEGKGLYARWSEKYNQIRYNLDGQEFALYDIDSMDLDDPIVYKNNTIANELSAKIKDQIQNLARRVNVKELKNDEEKYGKKGKDSIAEALGIEEEELVTITEVDLDQKIEEHPESEQDKKQKDTTKEKEEEFGTIKDIRIKQDLNMSTMVTSMRTIGKALERAGKLPKVSGKNFTKIGVVESNEVKNIDKNVKTNTTRFSLVAIATDGTVVPINLEQDHQEGNNPREISHRINADGRVEQDDTNSRFIIGNSGETLSIKFSNGPGYLEVGYSMKKTLGGNGIEGNVSYDTQLQTNTVYWQTRKDSRPQEYTDGIYAAEDMAYEAKKEAEHNSDMKRGQKGMVDTFDNHEYKNVEGELDTKSFDHIYDIVERARNLMSKNDEVANVFTEEEVIKRLEKAHKNGEDLENEEQEIVDDAERLPSRDL